MEQTHCKYCGNRLTEKTVENRERLYCRECDKVNWRVASPSIGVFLVRDGKILLIKRGIKPFKDKWSIPEGFSEVDEVPEEAAVRELKEETGLETERDCLKLLKHKNLDLPVYGRVLADYFLLNWENVEGKVEAGDDASEARFWSLEEVKENSDRIRQEHLELIKKLLEN